MERGRSKPGTNDGSFKVDPLASSGDVDLGGSPASNWPTTTLQAERWSTNPNQVDESGRRPNREERMLREIATEIPPTIAEIAPPALSAETGRLCEEASARIAHLEARAEHLAGIGELLIRSEAVASSKIERVYATAEEMAQALAGEDAATGARSILNAARALTALTESCDDGRELTADAILAAHGALMRDDKHEGRYAGRFRDAQNWIGGSNFCPLHAVYVPPPPRYVPELIDDAVRFANRDDMSAIAQAAITHAQFETIHPFGDGNGRIGRAIISATLRRRGATQRVVVPVAAAMLADVDSYFTCLEDYRTGDADQMVAYVARASIHASEAATVSADRIAALPVAWRDAARPRRGSAAAALLDKLVVNPVLDAQRATHLSEKSTASTYLALDSLTEAGVLREVTGAGRNRIWVASDIFDEVGELEHRIGLRSKPSGEWLSR